MTKTDINGVAIDLWRQGTGRPILFLHPGDGFAPDDPFLCSLAENHDVLAPWHPGFGHSDLPPGWNTVDDLANFYLGFLEHQQLEDTILIGASFGGWIAAEMALRGSARLAKLVLIDALGVKFSDHVTRDIADFHNTNPGLIESLKWANPEGRQPDLTELDDDALTAVVRSREAFAHYGWRPYMHNPVLTRWLHRIALPTLVVWGAKDGIVTTDYGRTYAERIPGANFEVVEDAGHYPHIEKAQATMQRVRAFIEG